MSKLTYKVSYYALYVMFALIIAVIALFYFGGNAEGAAVLTGVDPEMWQPANTDFMLYLMYALLAIAIVTTLAGAIFKFGSALRDNPVNALKSLLGLILLIVLLVVTWSIGSDEPLRIPGYDGADNVPFWLKLTDMFLYSIYFLFGATVVAIIINSIKNRLS